MQIHTLANFGSIFGVDGIVLLVLGLLIFGRRLPEVGKNIGQTIVEFKKGLNGKGLEEEAPQEPETPSIRSTEKRQPRMTASTPSTRAKSLPTTEEV